MKGSLLVARKFAEVDFRIFGFVLSTHENSALGVGFGAWYATPQRELLCKD
jgi:hypothetical protein